MSQVAVQAIRKLPTFIPGFDLISGGGFPEGRVSLITGTAGSGKTILAMQWLVEGLRNTGESAVFVTFEEPAEDIRRNMAGFGWDLRAWENQGRLTFVDGAFASSAQGEVAGAYDLGGLLARIEHAIRKSGAKRVALDSFSAVLTQFPEIASLRQELFRISLALKGLGVTTIVTAERNDDHGPISRSGVEEFVVDNVVILRNVLEEEKRRRTVEVLKFRGAAHQTGEFPLTILSGVGMIVVPLSGTELKQGSTDLRITTGIPTLDQMCEGGLFRDSVTLVSGATGTGKTLLVTEFIKGGSQNGERSLLFAFEESRAQLGRNAAGWGVDYDEIEGRGQLRIVCQYPEVTGPEEHLVQIKRLIEEYKPDRVAIDSLSALERVSSPKSFREFVLGLTSHVKDKNIAGLFTATTEGLLGGASITSSNLSTVTDSIIMLRYLEFAGEVRRGLTVLKMRGSNHDKGIREFWITTHGMEIGEKLTGVTGILSGSPAELGFRQSPGQ